MSQSVLNLAVVGAVLTLIQALAALVWFSALDPQLVRRQLRSLPFWGWAAVVIAGAGLVEGFLLAASTADQGLVRWGRIYMAVLHLQLIADLFVVVFWLTLRFWPKGGGVALAAFREGLRQPMFWLLFVTVGILMFVVTLLPYFTLGEDFKMVEELEFDLTMLAAVVFGVIMASMSISEEIEGRTAVTLMSKPVSRRQFLLGKFVGILLASLVMTTLLGWWLVWMLDFKNWYDPGLQLTLEKPPDPKWVVDTLSDLRFTGESGDLIRGLLLWTHDAGRALPKLVIVFCQVMVLLAIAVALATRLPMIVNLPVCVVFYFLGHLTPILTAVTANKQGLRERLVGFTAGVFDTVLPGLEHFNLGPAIVRDTPLPPHEFALYTLSVTLYALLYTGIALLFGLILFEDRDLA
jgi:ABC-type transport system involved in multi-copper enzyme maturation permease subunit